MTIIDTWMVPVEQGAAEDRGLLKQLGSGERERISRMGLAEDRDRAVTARVAARIVVGSRLGVVPSAVPLASYGPPTVKNSDVSVSWSHSGRWVALAACRGRSVGIDIERVPERLNMQALSELGVASLEEFVRLEAANKATQCASGGAWPPGVAVRRLGAPTGYFAAVAAPGDDWTHELHVRSPIERSEENARGSLSIFGGLCYAPLLPLPSREGWFL